ncbi:MAG: YafQ family addiction module toxin [Thiotrichaceae bacterium IS1]|nr:MAG: YafQ family addiction module toxin [Thiotrichaceae bacterium IS1]
MKAIRRLSQFKKDIKRLQKAGNDFTRLEDVIEPLLKSEKLAVNHRDQALSGKYHGYRECHLPPDWLLIYQCTKTELVLVRTGSHAELFE